MKNHLSDWSRLVQSSFNSRLLLPLIVTGFFLFHLASVAQEVVKGEQKTAIMKAVSTMDEMIQYDNRHPELKDELHKPANDFGEREEEEVAPFYELPADATVYSDTIVDANRMLPQSSRVLASPAPTTTFNAVDDDNWIPPDVGGAVGPNYIMTTLNGQYRILNRTGSVITSVTMLAFWNGFGVSDVFDPKILYDPFNQRWINTGVAERSSAASCILIAVSATNDPTGTWYKYKIDATSTDTMWADYPSIGYNKNWIVVTTNMFGNIGGGFQAGHQYVMNKANFYSAGSGQYTLINGGSNTFTLCPAITCDTTTTTMYLVERWNANSGGSGSIRTYTITGSVGSEILTAGSFTTTPNPWSYGGGNFAPQSGSVNKIDCDDDRMMQVILRNGSIWAVHGIFLPSASPTRCSIQCWQLTTAGALTQRILIDDVTGTNFYAFPSIAVNKFDDVLIGCAKFSATTFASACYSFRLSTDPTNTIQSDYVYKAGLASYFKTFGGTRNRWGDYTSTLVDPTNDNDFWTLQEYALPPSGGDRWGTWWAYLANPRSPVANFTTNVTTACTNSNVIFSNASAGTFTTYSWDFGANASPATSTSAGPINVQYSTTGLKTISLTVSSTAGSNTVTKTNFINVVSPPAAAGAIAGLTGVCQGQNGIAYSVASIAGATGYSWSIPNGASIAAGTNTNAITVNYSAFASSGNISVSGTNSGCSGTASSSAITVNALPSKITSQTFTSSSAITITDNSISSPYPSTIPVSGFSGPTQDVNVILTGLNHTNPDDIDLLLESPSGQRILLMSDCGGSTDIVNATITFNDSASSNLPDASAIVTGSYKPTNFGTTNDDFPSPGVISFSGPTGNASTPLSAFNNFNPNGTWKLYVVDGLSSNSGTIASWKLVINAPVANGIPVIAGTASVCQGQSGVAYSVASASGVTGYNWSLPAGASIATGANTNSITVNFLAGATSGNISVTPFNSCGNSAASSAFAVTVNPAVTASVTISANPSGPICSGTSVTFTAVGVNDGTTPIYTWKKNSVSVRIGTSYTVATLNNNDTIKCILSSNATCVSGSPATSNVIIMTVNPNVTAGVSIAANPAGAICPYTPVTFTATPSNGGSTPSYQWKKNSVSVATGNPYSDSVFTNNDTIKCVMTSNAACVNGNPFTSNPIILSVTNCGTTLHLKVFIQGLYTIGGNMNPVLDPGNHPTLCDSVTVELHDAGTPGPVAYRVKSTINVDGNGIFLFPAAVNGHSYYIVVRNRNALETWSKNTFLFNLPDVSFDFTSP